MAGQQKEKRSYESVVAQLRANDPEYAKNPAQAADTSPKVPSPKIVEDAATFIALHKQGVSVSYKGILDDLKHAAGDGELDLVRYLCEANDFYRGIRSSVAAGALYAAAAHGHLHIVKYFRQNGIGPDSKTATYAAQDGHINILEYMRTSTQDFLHIVGPCINTAARACRIDVLNYIKSTGADIKRACRSTFHSSGIITGNKNATPESTATLRFLINNSDFGKPPEATDAQPPFPHGDLESLASQAGACGHVELLQILHQEHNVDLNRFSEHFLKKNAIWGRNAVLVYMTQNGIKLTEKNTLTALHSAAHTGDDNALRHILQHTQPTNETLASLAPVAVAQQKYKILQILEDRGIPLGEMSAFAAARYAQWKLWQQVQHIEAPTPISDRSPHYFRPKAYQEVLEMLETEGRVKKRHNYMMDRPAAIAASFLVDRTEVIYAYNATGLFKTTDRVLAYFEKWGTNTKQPLHDVLHMIQLPRTGHFNIAAWGDAVMRHGPKMARLVQFADAIPEPAKDGSGQWSYTKTAELASRFLYKHADAAPDLALHCHVLHWHENSFNNALQIVQQYRTDFAKNAYKKPRHQIPVIEIEGSVFDKPGYQFYKLPDGDVRGLLLGEFTDCCQHLNGAGESCAQHGFLSPHGGFYVIADTKADTIIAQSWAWRGQKGELVLDSLETLNGHMNKMQWQKLLDVFTAAAHCQKKCEITAVCIGKGGDTASLPYPTQEPAARPVDRKPYGDSTRQYRVPYSETRLALPRPV